MNATQQPLLKSDPLIDVLEERAIARIIDLRSQAIALLRLPRGPFRETSLSRVRAAITKAERKMAGIKQLTLGVVAEDRRGGSERSTLGVPQGEPSGSFRDRASLGAASQPALRRRESSRSGD